ncbi:unnamed protein product [Penicillium olsonii]|uniref:Uncharacterized protein n=1 Tax=Penicillium olsonii TaxID=99116 RepID=A0A9W4I591_PENOL|nr:unnamed protein product [Penicillium olsonii]CAG7924001.1 unnamed protein product [Penicillium olsonii]CAG7948489.1 unnamed protein product [Penicillium olsonii]CAG8221109.1 unnamed protein product [Penicillium olsonii]CAG8233633.1 unnamed protein product [Penicillium olsonii]
MLDDVIIQEGEFTTDYFTKLDVQGMAESDERDGHDEASAAMDRVLGNRVGGSTRVFEAAEDKEDLDAAKNAQKEQEHADDGDFEENAQTTSGATDVSADPSAPHVGSQPGHIDDYLLRFMEWNMRDEPLVLPPDKSKKKSKKGKEHHLKRRR